MDALSNKFRTRTYKSLLDFTIRRLPGFASPVFAMLVSRQVADYPFYGAIWFLTGQVFLLCAEAYYRMFKSMFSKRRRTVYALVLIVAAVCCAVATFFFMKGLKPKQALALFVFAVNQLAGVALLEGSALIPIPERSKLAVNLSSFLFVSTAALAVCRFVALNEIPWLMALYDAVFIVLLILKAVVKFKEEELNAGSAATPVDDLEDIYAYRQYRRMAANALISVEITVMLLASYFLAIPGGSGSDALLTAALMLAVFGVGMWACRLLLSRKRLNALGSDIAFLLFALLWIFIGFYAINHPAFIGQGRWILTVAIVSLCMASLSAILLNMDRYMVIIGNIGTLCPDKAKYSLFRNATYHLGAVMSRLVFLIVITALTIFYTLSNREVYLTAATLNRSKLFIIPLAFLALAAISAVQQPLTKYTEQKLSRYSILKLSGKVSRSLEQKLILTLVKKGGKRIGIKLLRAVVKPFVTLRRIGVEKVNPKLFPCVFVCNHAEVFGPIAATVNIPFFNRPWIIDEMVDKQKIAEHLQTGFDNAGWLPRAIRSRLGRALGPFMLWVMRSMDPIPVYRNSLRDISKTIELSTEALESDDCILIFPENPRATDNRYVIGGVGGFFEGFVHIARNYCRNTGKPLVFYSVFADARKRTISFSDGIEFDAKTPFNEERERICRYLHDEMVRMQLGSE